MRIFKITDKIEVVCKAERTRSGFRHLATLFINEVEHETEKVCYLNRTWESYEFQTVLQKLFNKKSFSLSDAEKKQCLEFSEKDNTDWSNFKMVSQIARLGDVFTSTPKESNDWKTRMIKAGFGEAIQIPEDWNTLSEETKSTRLNLVIEQLSSAGSERKVQ